MKVEKKVIGQLEKCYSIAPLHYQGKDHILAAAEKTDRCILFDIEGNEADTVWTEPGGVMTMVQVPGTDGQFLSTHKFYSPNDSKESKIVIVTPVSKGNWEVRTLVDLPHVHRFDILTRGGIRYLIACTLKSGHDCKEDWTQPGKVYVAKLPDDLSGFYEGNQLPLTVLMDSMLRNHGYFRMEKDDILSGLISADNGVFEVVPPENADNRWEVRKLLDVSASDGVMIDLDGDGELEIILIEPFHGSQIRIYKKRGGEYEKAYEYPKPAEFAHAIFGGILLGRPAVVIGHRRGARDLIVFTWDELSGTWQFRVLDSGCGAANVYKYTHNGKDILISANREIDEVAMYLLSED